MTDEQLMVQVKTGYLQQMSALFERYHRRLYGFFFRLTYDQAVSEDLTQNVFERVLRYRSTYNEAYSFQAWVFQIARNVRAEYQKKRIRQATEPFEPKFDTRLVDDGPGAQLEKKEKLRLLEQALQHLKEEQREILLLTRFQGMKYSEVAQLLNCSEGAVKVKVYRAMRQLRTIYLKAYEH